MYGIEIKNFINLGTLIRKRSKLLRKLEKILDLKTD